MTLTIGKYLTAKNFPNYGIYICMLWPDSQPSSFQSGLVHFEVSWLALKWANSIHNR